ncbi:MAG: TRAP transporter substrate-binding protein [Bacillota bacterium]
MRKGFCGKVVIVLLCILIFAFVLVGCGGTQKGAEGDSSDKTQAPPQKIVLKFAHDHQVTSPFQKSAEKYKEIVEQRSNGQIEVQIYPAQQLGSAREMIEGMQMGTIELTLLPTAKFGGFDQRLTIVDLPFLFPNEEVMWKVLEGDIGREIMSGLDNIGIKGLSFYAEGFKAFTSNVPITKPSDFQGKKIRTMEAPVIMAQFKAWGASPVPIDFAEVYNALQQKVVDGHENPIISIHDMKFYEVQKYIIFGDHAYLSYFMSLSKKWFESLPPDLQKIVWDAGLEVAQFHKSLMDETNQKYLQNIKNYGTEVIVLTEEEREAFRKASLPVYDEFRNVIGADLLDKTIKFIEENK